MTKIVFLNDKFIPYEDAFVHIEDRGFQFGDGVYEVILFENNHLIDFEDHIKRLFRSLGEIELKTEKTAKEFQEIFLKLFKDNNQTSGYVYLQITRGSNPRSQDLPKSYSPTINAITSPLKIVNKEDFNNGFKVITHDDIRWNRCDIKSVALLGSLMLKEKANKANAIEAILIKDGFVTEGSFCNVFIVNNKNQIITRAPDNQILQGITRNRIIDLAKKDGLEVIEKKFTKEDLLNSKEVFLSSSTLKIRPIRQIDDKIIGNGKAGEVAKKLSKLYNDFCS